MIQVAIWVLRASCARLAIRFIMPRIPPAFVTTPTMASMKITKRMISMRARSTSWPRK